MIANRITTDEVNAENGGLCLMKNLTWEYDALPHALICGGTGGGKTYLLLTIIELCLQDTNGIENFVKNFAKSYYTWKTAKKRLKQGRRQSAVI